MTINEATEQQARSLAADNRKAEPSIIRMYWFPDEREVRLVGLSAEMPENGDRDLHPFYFQPSPQDGLPLPSRIALIRPDEFGTLVLPDGWGGWDDAVLI
jgi:hypothetical protein